MGKKAFISKKNATKYDLVFRPSTDPNAAPEREWVESTRNVGIGRPDAERLAQQTHAGALAGGRFPPGHPLAWLQEPPKAPLSDARRQEIIALGFPDDGYDYLQHMRRGHAAQAEEPAAPSGSAAAEDASQIEAAYGGPSVYIPAPSFEAPPEDYKAIDASRLTIHQAADTDNDAMLVAGGASAMARELHTVRKRYQEELDEVERLMRQYEDMEGPEAADADDTLLEDFLLAATEAGQGVRFADEPELPQPAAAAARQQPGGSAAAGPEGASEDGLSDAGSSGNSSGSGWAPPASERRPASQGSHSFASTYWRPERTDRNEALSAIDERFEQLALEYDSDEIGSLEGDEGEGPDPSTRGAATTDQFAKIMDGFLAQHATRAHAHEGGIPYQPPAVTGEGEEDEEAAIAAAALAKTKERLRCMEEAEAAAPAGDREPPLQEEPRRREWDCESVLSTLSTAYNHPARLDARPPRPAAARGQIRLSHKTGLPVLEEAGPARVEGSVATGRTAASLPVRRPGESAEEKKQRKEAVKDAKRQARAAKKDLKLLFKEEAAKQQRAAAPAVSAMRIA